MYVARAQGARHRVGPMNYRTVVRLASRPASVRTPATAAGGKEEGHMTEGEYQPVTVSRRINSSAHDIFQILANPARHKEFDGSDSLRGARSCEVVTAGR